MAKRAPPVGRGSQLAPRKPPRGPALDPNTKLQSQYKSRWFPLFCSASWDWQVPNSNLSGTQHMVQWFSKLQLPVKSREALATRLSRMRLELRSSMTTSVHTITTIILRGGTGRMFGRRNRRGRGSSSGKALSSKNLHGRMRGSSDRAICPTARHRRQVHRHLVRHLVMLTPQMLSKSVTQLPFTTQKITARVACMSTTHHHHNMLKLSTQKQAMPINTHLQ